MLILLKYIQQIMKRKQIDTNASDVEITKIKWNCIEKIVLNILTIVQSFVQFLMNLILNVLKATFLLILVGLLIYISQINIDKKILQYVSTYGKNIGSRFEAPERSTIYPLERGSTNERVRSP